MENLGRKRSLTTFLGTETLSCTATRGLCKLVFWKMQLWEGIWESGTRPAKTWVRICTALTMGDVTQISKQHSQSSFQLQWLVRSMRYETYGIVAQVVCHSGMCPSNTETCTWNLCGTALLIFPYKLNYEQTFNPTLEGLCRATDICFKGPIQLAAPPRSSPFLKMKMGFDHCSVAPSHCECRLR